VSYFRRVSWNDCDPSGLIRFQAAFDWFVDAELEFLRERGIEWVFEVMPRVAANSSYSRPLRFDNELTIDVRVVEVGRSSVTYRFTVTTDGEEAAVGNVTCVYVEEGRSASLPDVVRSVLESDRDRP